MPALADLLEGPGLCRAVVDLKVKDNSYNEIVDFCARVFHVTVHKDEIAQILAEAGRRAKHLNGIYDSQVKPATRYIAIDEIFQGQRNCYLGCAAPASHYLFLLRRIKNRSEAVLRETLVELAAGFKELQLVITDGLRQYGVVVPDAFEDAVHLLCQVHAFRIVLRAQEDIDREASKAHAAKKLAKEALSKARTKIYGKRRQLKALKAKLANGRRARDAYNRAHGIKPYSKKASRTPERQAFKARLNQLQVEIRSKSVTIARAEGRVPKLKRALERAENRYRKKQQASLQAGRLVARFKALLRDRPADFAADKARMDEILAHSGNAIASKLRGFLRDHPEAFATKVPDLDALCPPSAASTNILEGIFGLLRPLLKKARRFGMTPATAALFEIVRLRHNLTPPYTGPNKGTSPLERAGVHSRYGNYLDALFPPNWNISPTCESAFESMQDKFLMNAPLARQNITDLN